MQVKVKKNVLLSFVKRLQENKSSRGDTLFNNTTGFFGNFGSVKTNDSPIKPSKQMALQLSTEEPPVEDPDYVPVTKEELGLAAVRIAREVPSKKIEFFYRKLHKLLDAALDEDDAKLFSLQEAIDYDLVSNPAHKKMIKDLVDQAIAMATRDKKGMTTQDAANFVMQNRMVSRYPDISIQDVIDEIEEYVRAEQDEPSEEEQLADQVADSLSGVSQPSDAFVTPPESLPDLSPDAAGRRRIARGAPTRVIGDEIPAEKKKRKRKKKIEQPSDDVLDKKAEDEMMDMLASAYSEFTEMDEYAATWNWENFKEEAPYLKVLFDTIKILHQLSYRLLQANYINKYGGYVYDPEADTRGGKKGAFVLEKQGPTSRPEAQAMMRRIHSDFGLTYENMMRQQNILKMEHQQLVSVIERAMIGIFQRVPETYGDFNMAVQADMSNRGLSGTVDEVASEALGFLANVLAHKYKGESEILDRDLVNVAIAGIFKRCLLDLPTELGISPAVTLSVDALTKKKTEKTDRTFGFNLAGAMKRFEKLRKDPKIAKQIKKLMPKLILGKITETKTAKVTKSGSKYNFEDKSTKLAIELKGTDLKKKIADYVNGMLEGKKPSFDVEEATMEADLETGAYDPAEEEKEAKSRLDKDQYETRKIVQEMEKMISSGDWMHIAPLFGFSGAPGVRSWYLRYPQRKFMIMQAARADSGPSGAKRYLEVFREMRENLADSLITMSPNKPGVLDLMIDEISSKPSLSTSDQQMIGLLEEMRNNIEDLSNLYYDAESYEQLEEESPEELKRLSNTPGGSLLRFGIGAVFDRIIKDMDTEWHSEMKAYLETKNGLPEKKAHDLAYYFTGLKNKPSGGDFKQDKGKLSNAAEAFVNAGMQAEEFFEALRYSQGWFFSTLDRELQQGVESDNYYNMVRQLTSQPLYVSDKKSPSGFKLDKKVYKIFKKLIEGKNGAVSAYLDQLAIEQFQQKTQQKIQKIKSDNPADLFT